MLGKDVVLAGDVVGELAQATVDALGNGDVCLLENVRYEPGEESKVEAERVALAEKYAALGDVFVSDGFGVVHRKQASVYDIAKLLPSAAGLLVKKEVDVFSKVLSDPERPFVVVLGGAKVADKMGLDIGPESEKLFAEAIKSAKTVVWNGPMGVFEIAELAGGTAAVAQALTEVEGLSVVGGGDSAAAVRDLGHADDEFGHISTGGGASLEYLEGKDLPGLTVMEEGN